ncbi:acetyl-CoA synthetase [Sulfolobales archaeon HS-7]|nr:acetyl-CoA synthetase [Sulfolobales archaeon HS-7]
MSKVYIAGASMTKVDRHYDMGINELYLETFQGLRNTVKEWIKPDTLIVANTYGEAVENSLALGEKLASTSSLQGIRTFRVENGDASGGAAIDLAFTLVKSGVSKTVLVSGVEKTSDYPSKYMTEFYSKTLNKYEFYSGINPASIAALMMNMYMKKYGKDSSYFAKWPIRMHSNAVENPYAYLKFKIDENTYYNSQVISSPLRLFDSGARADGAASVIVTDEENARKISDSPIEILGVSTSSYCYQPELTLPAVKDSFSNVTNKLGGVPKIIEIHDSYSILAALVLESSGLSKYGSSLDDIPDGVNLSGGLKARGYPGGATGIYQLGEIYMQLAGTFPGKRETGESGAIISTGELGSSAYSVVLVRK